MDSWLLDQPAGDQRAGRNHPVAGVTARFIVARSCVGGCDRCCWCPQVPPKMRFPPSTLSLGCWWLLSASCANAVGSLPAQDTCDPSAGAAHSRDRLAGATRLPSLRKNNWAIQPGETLSPGLEPDLAEATALPGFYSSPPCSSVPGRHLPSSGSIAHSTVIHSSGPGSRDLASPGHVSWIKPLSAPPVRVQRTEPWACS